MYAAVTGSQTGGESLKMEMSQEGFSAAYVPGVIQQKLLLQLFMHLHGIQCDEFS